MSIYVLVFWCFGFNEKANPRVSKVIMKNEVMVMFNSLTSIVNVGLHSLTGIVNVGLMSNEYFDVDVINMRRVFVLLLINITKI